ncbi:M48 family metallopeptidase [Nocardiopsis alkaliphila]|uniref:M48 family metallopeptidase n=1 Tax=Nocardiopsis alkaliphila TaxID=225762 RepID=UPI0003463DF4|nr:M48 family metallopeptidase [Nocardiopsis alkaliphila]
MPQATPHRRPAPALCAVEVVEDVVPPSGHPWEKPLFTLCALVSLLMIAALAHLAWSVPETSVWVLAALIAPPVMCWWTRGLRYARERSESVRVSPTQFPEAHRLVVSLATDMGVPRTPEAYVRVGAPSPRADAAGHGLRRYLVLPAALFDELGRLRDPSATAFLIAHQLGHVVAGHTGYWQRLLTLGAELVPGLGASLSRTREYTADDHACAHVPQGVHAVCLFAGGSNLYTRVNLGEMAARASAGRTPSSLLYHLLSRHPGNARRMAALRDRTRRGRVLL